MSSPDCATSFLVRATGGRVAQVSVQPGVSAPRGVWIHLFFTSDYSVLGKVKWPDSCVVMNSGLFVFVKVLVISGLCPQNSNLRVFSSVSDRWVKWKISKDLVISAAGIPGRVMSVPVACLLSCRCWPGLQGTGCSPPLVGHPGRPLPALGLLLSPGPRGREERGPVSNILSSYPAKSGSGHLVSFVFCCFL